MTGKARVLVVDDERSMREFLEIFFRSEGYDVTTAGDLASAHLHLETNEFDVAVTDVRMPGGSGIELLHTVRESSPETVVIIMTAFASTDTAIAAVRDGSQDLAPDAVGFEETFQVHWRSCHVYQRRR